MTKEKSFKFESAMEELEKIVAQLEEENSSLEKSLELYEKGVKISPPKKNECGHISTYTQDTVVKANLNEEQQRKFSRSLIANIKSNDKLSPDLRQKKVMENCRKFIKDLS